MQTETVMASAMKKAGFNKVEAEIRVALSRWRDKITKDRLLELISEAYATPDEGLAKSADEASDVLPSVRQPNGEGEADRNVPKGRATLASPSPSQRDGTGQSRRADEGPLKPARPARELNKMQSDAMVQARQMAAKAVLDLGWLGSAHVPMGPRAVDIRICDLPGMVARQVTEMGTHGKWAVALEMIRAELAKRKVSETSEALWIEHLPVEVTRRISAATEKETLIPMAVGWAKGFISAAQIQVSDAA